ncbi:FAD-binding oxidoreductase [Thiohalomonas denitrificans]|uniref:FAD-binding oxidoreductase n=1 Tax=Thiohalomonas denitrificans TaxID=415747 RepID=UPI0026E955C4|nr:FAD-linked oxidase C-terminal domain-containing protein [Thiohalomonas denitrificans]
MNDARLAEAQRQRFLEILGTDGLLLETADRWTYGYDNSRRHCTPLAVALPANAVEVAAVVALCNESNLSLVVRGRGTGTAGAAVPIAGGLVLSTERLDRIIQVDPDNRVLVTQPGATNQAVQQAAAEYGFFWPPDPTSAAVCTIGGNLSCNAAGPRAVKYGTPRENTLGLRGVTGDGRPLRTGVYTTKGVVGYDLTRLLLGSEGTLGVITEATLKLSPLPEARRTLRALYRSTRTAAEAVARIMAQPVTPCALEFMDEGAIGMIRNYSKITIPEEVGALLMIEVDGPAACIDHAADAVAEAARNVDCLELIEARNAGEIQALWQMRKALSPALRNVAPKKINEDVVVPVSRMPDLIDGLNDLGRHYGITIVNFGHAGNGNIHVNLLVDPDDPSQMGAAAECLSDIFDMVLGLDGTLSGEHGIGLDKRDYVVRETDPVALDLMHRIKAQFDPRGILNPGKKLPPLE